MGKHKMWLLAGLLAVCSVSMAVETGMYRLLSISETEKLILVSQIPSKTKYLLDASSAKITVNGKAAEYSDLKAFSIIHLKMNLKKTSKNGVNLDGSATEIRVSDQENPK